MKKYAYIILIIVFTIVLIYFFFLHKSKEAPTIKTISQVFADIKKQYGESIAKNVERIYRLETNHFKSKQYINTGSAGMLKFGESFPYGWHILSEFWSLNQKYAPTGFFWQYFDNIENKEYNYIAFANNGGFYTLAEFLNKYGNNAGRWNSTNPEKQEIYNSLISEIQTEFV